MTAQETAENIARFIDKLARIIGEKVTERHMRPEDWLTESTVQRVVEDAARTVLIAWITGNLKVDE